MAYSDLIQRTDAAALIPEDVAREIIQGSVAQSGVLSMARRLQNMPRAQQRQPVLSLLPTAYFVSGDTGLKQTTNMQWENKYINAEEIAVIVPIPEAVLDDQDYDIWGEIKPRLEEAIGVVIDQAVLLGTNAPASWPDDVLTAATAASQVVDLSTQIAAGEDLYDVIMGESGLLALVENDGFMVSGHLAAPAMRGKLRGLREKVWNGTSLVASGEPIFQRSMQEAGRYDLDGSPITFLRNNALGSTVLQMSGDFSQMVYSFRQDITYKILDQAVIQDNTGAIIYNLAQQDMVALRAVLRMGWQIPNPINRMNTNSTTRYPFSILVP